jgi:DNA-binding response OmpR family regulator
MLGKNRNRVRPEKTDVRLHGKKILIVTDNLNFGTLTEGYFSPENRVVIARNDQSSFEIIRNIFRPDIIINDIDRALCNQESLSDMLNEKSSTAQIPILSVSAKEDLPIRVNTTKTAISGYFRKPVGLKDLELQIFKLLKTNHKN